MIVSSVQWLSAEFRNAGSLDCEDVRYLFFSWSLAHVAPKRQTNTAVWIINQSYVLSDFLLTRTQLDCLFFRNFCYNSYHVESFHLENLLDTSNICEVKSLFSYRPIILNFVNLSIFLKYNAEIIFNGSKPFISHFYHSIRKQVDLIFENLRFKLISCFVKESTLYLCAVHVY